MTSIEIPSSVTNIGFSAFSGCSALTSVTYNPKNCVSGANYSNPRFPSSVKTITIGSSVESIPSYMFSSGHRSFKTLWQGTTPPSGYETLNGIANYAINNQYSALNNLKVYPNIKHSFVEDGFTYITVSPAARQCDAIDFSNSMVESVVLNKVVHYNGIEMNVRNINPYTFYNDTLLASVKLAIAGGIKEYAFEGCNKLASVKLGTDIDSIGVYAFKGCNSVGQIVCGATVPPVCSAETFGDIDKWDCKLYVPDESIDAYQVANGWKDFFFVDGISTDIKQVMGESDDDLTVDVYSLDGNLLYKQIDAAQVATELRGSTLILRSKSGKTRKVVVE